MEIFLEDELLLVLPGSLYMLFMPCVYWRTLITAQQILSHSLQRSAIMHAVPYWAFELPQLDFWTFFWRLTLAAALGGIVGLERELSGHPAGLRTNILIATSSCLFTLLSIHAFPLVGSAQDTARIAAQVVTGVGFLGAGTVIHTKGTVYGLTTAATVWMVATVGMAVATDLYLIGIVTTLMTTGVLALLAPLSRRLADRADVQQKKHQLKAEEDKEQNKSLGIIDDKNNRREDRVK